MKAVLKSLFSDKDGSISMKRLVMLLLTFVFILLIIVNLFWGKIVEASLVSSLVALMWYIYSLVFGENVTNIFNKKTDTITPPPTKTEGQ